MLIYDLPLAAMSLQESYTLNLIEHHPDWLLSHQSGHRTGIYATTAVIEALNQSGISSDKSRILTLHTNICHIRGISGFRLDILYR